MLKAAKCPSCGGSIKVPVDQEYTYCMYCGTQIIVTSVLKQHLDKKKTISNFMNLANTALTGGEFEEAESYFNRVLELDSKHHSAWLGKSISVLHRSTLKAPKYQQFFKLFDTAMSFAPVDSSKQLEIKKSQAIKSFVARYTEKSNMIFSKPITNMNLWKEHAQRCADMYKLLEHSFALNRHDELAHKLVIIISKSMLDGFPTIDSQGTISRRMPSPELRDWAFMQYDKSATILKEQDATYSPPEVRSNRSIIKSVKSLFGKKKEKQ